MNQAKSEIEYLYQNYVDYYKKVQGNYWNYRNYLFRDKYKLLTEYFEDKLHDKFVEITKNSNFSDANKIWEYINYLISLLTKEEVTNYPDNYISGEIIKAIIEVAKKFEVDSDKMQVLDLLDEIVLDSDNNVNYFYRVNTNLYGLDYDIYDYSKKNHKHNTEDYNHFLYVKLGTTLRLDSYILQFIEKYCKETEPYAYSEDIGQLGVNLQEESNRVMLINKAQQMLSEQSDGWTKSKIYELAIIPIAMKSKSTELKRGICEDLIKIMVNDRNNTIWPDLLIHFTPSIDSNGMIAKVCNNFEEEYQIKEMLKNCPDEQLIDIIKRSGSTFTQNVVVGLIKDNAQKMEMEAYIRGEQHFLDLLTFWENAPLKLKLLCAQKIAEDIKEIEDKNAVK